MTPREQDDVHSCFKMASTVLADGLKAKAVIELSLTLESNRVMRLCAIALLEHTNRAILSSREMLEDLESIKDAKKVSP